MSGYNAHCSQMQVDYSNGRQWIPQISDFIEQVSKENKTLQGRIKKNNPLVLTRPLSDFFTGCCAVVARFPFYSSIQKTASPNSDQTLQKEESRKMIKKIGF